MISSCLNTRLDAVVLFNVDDSVRRSGVRTLLQLLSWRRGRDHGRSHHQRLEDVCPAAAIRDPDYDHFQDDVQHDPLRHFYIGRCL